MKNIYTFLVVFIMLLSQTAISQNLIAVQNGGNPTFYTNIDSAVINAQNGDTLYISGGPYLVSNDVLVIDKELHIIGAGHNPNETTATYQTKVFGNINLVSGSNNSSFQGIYLTGLITAGTSESNEDVDDINISRCTCNSIGLSRFSSNWSITENVISYGIVGNNLTTGPSNAQNNYISNNIIQNNVGYFGINNVINNNIFLSSPSLTNIEGSLLENNIFLYGVTYFNGITSCVLNNNLFVGNIIIPYGNMGNDNIGLQPQESIFVNQIGNTFDYTHDYHLQPSCPGKNAGKDGTDIGIYGGVFPWKEGSIPFNPHFLIFDVSPATDSTGNLNVNIQVEAQDY